MLFFNHVTHCYFLLYSVKASGGDQAVGGIMLSLSVVIFFYYSFWVLIKVI